LIVLTSLVLLVHVLLLQARPMRWNQEENAGPARHRPFITRTLEIKPAPTVAAAPAPVRPPAARVAAVPSQKKRAPALDTQVQAIESVATPVAETSVTSDTPAPAPASELTTVEAAAGPGAGATTALTIPGSVRLKYAMTGRSKGLDYSAGAELDWLQDGQSYDAKMVVSALFLGSRTMTSSGRITADGLAPTRFSDRSRSERAAHFQADLGKISFSANTPDAPWLKGAQDRVSVFVQLTSLLAGDPAKYPVGSTVSLYTAGPSSADTWTFTVEAEEKLNLPAGEVSTVKLTRKPQRDYDQTIEVWFAPTLAYLPVRNRITQHNGDFVDQQLRGTEKP
jgi:hypothetical protein